MSLVEQAIARMKNQVGAAKPKLIEPAPTLISAVSTPDQASGAPRPAKRITLDVGAMRARGYLPEDGKERQFADHFRRIKRPLVDKALSGSAAVGDPRVIMITSALPGDGKTFTSVNLALSMALERDISVLLVDCDVVKHHVSDIVGLRDEPGLLDALVDESTDVESLVVQTNVSGLSILPAGKRVEATAEHLSSNRMRQIITNLCARNPRRVLLLDSPPLLITNEGRALVKVAGQVVLVVRAGYTSRSAVQDAVGLFDAQQTGGIILNQVVGVGESYYGSYGSYGTNGTEIDAP